MTVKIYTTPTCPHCKDTKAFFKEHDVEYEEINVAEDKEKAKEMIEKSGQKGVPVTVVGEGDDEEVIVGFNEEKLREALDL